MPNKSMECLLLGTIETHTRFNNYILFEQFEKKNIGLLLLTYLLEFICFECIVTESAFFYDPSKSNLSKYRNRSNFL